MFEVFSDWCRQESHKDERGAPAPCVVIGDQVVCLECLVGILEGEDYQIVQENSEALDYILGNPLNMLPPPRCHHCPFSINAVGEGEEEVIDCNLLGKQLDPSEPECEWPDWQKGLAEEVGRCGRVD